MSWYYIPPSAFLLPPPPLPRLGEVGKGVGRYLSLLYPPLSPLPSTTYWGE